MLPRSELRDCLVRVRSVLVKAENVIDKLQVLPELQVGSLVHVDMCAAYEHESSVVVNDDVVTEIMLKSSIEAFVVEAPKDSYDDGDDCIFGCFSPRATVVSPSEDIVVIMAPVMQIIMPELQNLCGEASPSPSLSMVQQQLDSLGTSSVVSTPPLVDLSQPLDFVDHGAKVTEAGALAPNSEALFIEELHNLLVSFEVAIPGSGKEIASLLAGKTTMGDIKKVKEYFKHVSKKSGTAKKAPKVD
jgi:hypothetical protein